MSSVIGEPQRRQFLVLIASDILVIYLTVIIRAVLMTCSALVILSSLFLERRKLIMSMPPTINLSALQQAVNQISELQG